MSLPRSTFVALFAFALCAPSLRGQVPSDQNDAHRLRVDAVEATKGVHIDGVLDDEVWKRARPVTAFVQAEPFDGRPATQKTEVRVAYDANNLYIGAYMHDSDPDRIVITDIKKDFRDSDQDGFGIILDTFHDRRNGYVFLTNPAGAKADWQTANEGREINTSWDAVWRVRTRRVADGWTAEMAIPFRSLRFDENASHPWGINFERRIRRDNEIAYWSPVPRSYDITRLSLAGDLYGLPRATGGRDLRVKPYLMGAEVRDVGETKYAARREAGVDVKAGIKGALTLDLTVNPDFAQVEADVQQVNLTQFSQFYPEKRDFFLENSGLFYVGDRPRNNHVTAPRPDEDLLLFFSRRVGVADDGRAIPIDGGARLTGQLHGLDIGAIAMRTRGITGVPGSDYGVVRLRQNIFKNSDIGGIFMMRNGRTRGPGGDDYNRVWGADANVRFLGSVDWSSYVVGTQSPGLHGSQYAWRTTFARESDFDHFKVGAMELGKNFRDDLGFYRRTDVRKYILEAGLRPRFAFMRRLGVREMHPHLSWSYYQDLAGHIVAKNLRTAYTFFLNDGGYWVVAATPRFEKIDEPLQIAPNLDPIPPGGYGWTSWQLMGQTDGSRMISGSFTGTIGGLWSGTQKTVNAKLTLRPSYRFFLEAGVQRTRGHLDIPDEDFTKTFWTFRSNYSFSTRMFVDALVQFDPVAHLLNTNVRFNFIHHPLSDLFIVFNEQRFTALQNGASVAPGRGLTVKLTQMVAF